MDNPKNVAVYVRQAFDNEQDFHFVMRNAEHLKKTAAKIGRVRKAYIDNRRGEGRPSWDDLMRDCRAGKIDFVITRSISQLGRNAADVLKMVRELDALGVQIYFECERLYSGSDIFKQIMGAICAAAVDGCGFCETKSYAPTLFGYDLQNTQVKPQTKGGGSV